MCRAILVYVDDFITSSLSLPTSNSLHLYWFIYHCVHCHFNGIIKQESQNLTKFVFHIKLLSEWIVLLTDKMFEARWTKSINLDSFVSFPTPRNSYVYNHFPFWIVFCISVCIWNMMNFSLLETFLWNIDVFTVLYCVFVCMFLFCLVTDYFEWCLEVFEQILLDDTKLGEKNIYTHRNVKQTKDWMSFTQRRTPNIKLSTLSVCCVLYMCYF